MPNTVVRRKNGNCSLCQSDKLATHVIVSKGENLVFFHVCESHAMMNVQYGNYTAQPIRHTPDPEAEVWDE